MGMSPTILVDELHGDFSSLKRRISKEGICDRYSIRTDEFERMISMLKIDQCESENGYDDTFTKQICVFIEEWLAKATIPGSNPLSLLIHGHPSSGKSTAIQQIMKSISTSVAGAKENLVPIFSEIQNSALLPTNQTTSIWHDVVSGSQSFAFRTSEVSHSIDSFCGAVKSVGGIPILFVDTVDILATRDETFIGKKWNEFLRDAQNAGLNIVFTCRTKDWEKIFLPEVEYKVESALLNISLPEILLTQINHVAGFDNEDFLQFSRVVQGFLPMLLRLKKDQYLYQSYWKNMENWFDSHVEWENPSSKSAIEILFDLLWESWQEDCENYNSDVDPTDVKIHFESYITEQFLSNYEENKSGRHFFSYLKLQEYIENNLQPETEGYGAVVLPHFFIQHMVKKNIIVKHRNLFEFSHHLFLTQTLLNSFNHQQKEKYNSVLQNYEDRRLYGCVKSWQKKQTQERQNDLDIVVRFYPRAKYPQAPEQREEQEDKLLRFFASESRRIQLLKGFAGTGKSRYCLKFIDHQFLHSGQKSSNACYVTLSEDLVGDVKDRWNFALKSDKDTRKSLKLISKDIMQNGKKKISFYSVASLLKFFYPSLEYTTYRDFKTKYKRFASKKKYAYAQGSARMSLDRAWLIIQNHFFDIITGQAIEKDKRKRPDGVGNLEWKVISDFVDGDGTFTPLCYGAYLANKRILNGGKIPAEINFDVITIDEVQDLPIPVIAFLINLLNKREEYALSKQLLLAGDEYQCINHSGFKWRDAINKLNQFALRMNLEREGIWKHLFQKTGNDNLIFGSTIYVEGLKYTYRNPPMITRFNQDAYRTLPYAVDTNPVGIKYSSFDSLKPRDFTYKPSQIVFVHSDDIKKTIELLSRQLNRDELRKWHITPQLLYPYDIDTEQLPVSENIDFVRYSAEDVKGLETGAVCILHPYEINTESLVAETQKEAFNEKRFNAWLAKDSNIATKMMDNLRYRMNVLLTRTESRLFVIWPENHNFEDFREVRNVGSNIITGFPESFLKENSGIKILHMTNDDLLNKQFFLELYEDEKESPELEHTFWEKQAINSLIKKDTSENKSRYWKMYFENVIDSNDRKNLLQTAQLMTGQSGNMMLDLMLNHHYSKSMIYNHQGLNAIDFNSQFFNIFELMKESSCFRKEWDELTDAIEMGLRSTNPDDPDRLRYQNLKDSFLKSGLKVDFSIYTALVSQIHHLIFEVLLRDRDYIFENFGERGVLAVANALSFHDSIFNTIEELNEFERFLLNLENYNRQVRTNSQIPFFSDSDDISLSDYEILQHLSSKLNGLQWAEDDTGDVKFDLFRRHWVVFDKNNPIGTNSHRILDSILTEVLSSYYINGLNAGKISGLDSEDMRRNQLEEFKLNTEFNFNLWKVLETLLPSSAMNSNVEFQDIIISLACSTPKFKIAHFSNQRSHSQVSLAPVSYTDFEDYFILFSQVCVGLLGPYESREGSTEDLNHLILSILYLNLLSEKGEKINLAKFDAVLLYFYKSIRWGGMEESRSSLWDVLLRQFKANQNLISSILSMIAKQVNSRYAGKQFAIKNSEEIFEILRDVYSEFKNVKIDPEIGATCGNIFSWYLSMCRKGFAEDGLFDLDFLTSVIDNDPINSVEYITYGVLQKYSSVQSLSGNISGFERLHLIPQSFFGLTEISRMLSLISEIWPRDPEMHEYADLMYKLHPLLENYIQSTGSLAEVLFDSLGRINKPIVLNDKFLPKSRKLKLWHPFEIVDDTLRYSSEKLTERIQLVFSNRIDRLYEILQDVLRTQREFERGERGLYEFIFNTLHRFNDKVQLSINSNNSTPFASTINCRICSIKLRPNYHGIWCENCGLNVQDSDADDIWHQNAEEILIILYMIHALDYNERASTSGTREISHNLIKILTQLTKPTYDVLLARADPNQLPDILPFAGLTAEALRSFYNKLQSSDSDFIKPFNDFWFRDYVGVNNPLSKIKMHQWHDDEKLSLYFYDLLFAKTKLTQHHGQRVFFDAEKIESLVKKEMNKSWNSGINLMDKYPEFDVRQSIAESKRVEHFSKLFNENEEQDNVTLGHISAEYESFIAHQEAIQLADSKFVKLIEGKMESYFHPNLYEDIERFCDKQNLYDKKFSEVVLRTYVRDNIGEFLNAIRYVKSYDEPIEVKIDVQRSNDLIGKMSYGSLCLIPTRNFVTDELMIIDDQTEFGHKHPIIVKRKDWLNYTLNYEMFNHEFKNKIRNWITRSMNSSYDFHVLTASQLYKKYIDEGKLKVDTKRRRRAVNIEDKQNIHLYPLAPFDLVLGAEKRKPIPMPVAVDRKNNTLFYPFALFENVLHRHFVKIEFDGSDELCWTNLQNAQSQIRHFEEGNKVLILESGEWIIDDSEE